MNHYFKHLFGFFGAVTLSVFCLGFSCNKSVEPVEPKDYPFYITDTGNDQIFVFHPITQKLDSIKVPWGVDAAITTSADGKLLYVALGSSVLVVDAKSLTTVDEIFYPHNYPVSVSPDNKLIAIQGGELYILRTSDYSLVFSDTTEFLYRDGVFLSNSRTFYCRSRPDQSSDEAVYKVDLSDSLFPMTKKSFADGSVTQILPSIDEQEWFLYLIVNTDIYLFEVYDVTLDSTIFRDVLVPGAGYETISPFGDFVFYTGPGRDGSTNDPNFKIFNIEKNQIEETVRDSTYYCAGVGCIAPRNLAISADGRWLGILGGSALIRPEFFVYDIYERKFVYRLGLDTGVRLFGSITTQKKK